MHRISSQFWCTEFFGKPVRQRISADRTFGDGCNKIRKHTKAVENGKSHQRPLLRQKIKKTSKGLIPIYIRITIDGSRLEQSIQRYVPAAQWSAAAGQVKGSNEQAHQINLYLDTLTSKVLRLEREMVIDGQILNFSNFREKWLGITEAPRMLIEVFQQHNDQMASLVKAGKDYSPGTLDRYDTARDHTRAFLQWKYGVDRYRHQTPELRICQRSGILAQNPAELLPQYDHEVYQQPEENCKRLHSQGLATEGPLSGF